MTRPKIGELLVEAHVLTREQVEHALAVQREDGRKLGQVLVELGYVSETQLTQTLSRQLSVPWVSLHHVEFARSFLNLVPRAVADKYNLIPIFLRNVRKQGETLYVATDDPTNDAALQELATAAGLPVRPMIACPSDVRNAIRVYYGDAEPKAATAPPAVCEEVQEPKAPVVAPVRAAVQTEPEPTELEDAVLTSIPPSAPPSTDSPRSEPAPFQKVPATTIPKGRAPRKSHPRMMSLTLLDGTSVQLPVARLKGRGDEAPREASDQLTARDLIDALRVSSQGVDMRQVLGESPQWEVFFAALLSLLLRKGLIADWEFVEELRKM